MQTKEQSKSNDCHIPSELKQQTTATQDLCCTNHKTSGEHSHGASPSQLGHQKWQGTCRNHTPHCFFLRVEKLRVGAELMQQRYKLQFSIHTWIKQSHNFNSSKEVDEAWTAANYLVVGLGIRCNRFNRFGLLGFHKLRFAKFRNRTVLSKIRNRQLRSSVPRFGFSV